MWALFFYIVKTCLISQTFLILDPKSLIKRDPSGMMHTKFEKHFEIYLEERYPLFYYKLKLICFHMETKLVLQKILEDRSGAAYIKLIKRIQEDAAVLAKIDILYETEVAGIMKLRTNHNVKESRKKNYKDFYNAKQSTSFRLEKAFEDLYNDKQQSPDTVAAVLLETLQTTDFDFIIIKSRFFRLLEAKFDLKAYYG